MLLPEEIAFLNHVKCSRRIGVDMNPDAGSHLAPVVAGR